MNQTLIPLKPADPILTCKKKLEIEKKQKERAASLPSSLEKLEQLKTPSAHPPIVTTMFELPDELK